MPNPLHAQSKILLIDDDANVVDVLRRALETHGYQNIEGTTDSGAALEVFKQFQPDLVVLDLRMPGLSGMEVLAALRAIIPADVYLPILVVTGNRSPEAVQEALGGGANDFVVKPYSPPEILARIGNLLDTRFLHLQLAEARETAERANAAKSEFLSRMSHELRTPLNAILGFGRLLEREGRDPEEADNIARILKAGRDLLGLVDKLLDISRSETGR